MLLLPQLTTVDTASRERFQSLTAGYYRRANLVLMVCSLDSEFTLTRLTNGTRRPSTTLMMLTLSMQWWGMKSDLAEHEREVTSDMLNGFAAHYNIGQNHVFEVSARTGKGVDNIAEDAVHCSGGAVQKRTSCKRYSPSEVCSCQVCITMSHSAER